MKEIQSMLRDLFYKFFTGKIIATLFCFMLLQVSYSQDTLHITYIANDGFLITTDTCKIIIDGIFDQGNPNFSYPAEDILLKERNAEYPFDSIDIILNSHFHADHLHAGYVTEHMVNDTTSVFIGPQQSYELLSAVEGFDTVQHRIYSINPAHGDFIDTLIKGTDIKVTRFVHHNDNNNQYQVNGYIFKLNGIKIFHPGDGTMNDMAELQALKLDEDSIDIAFLPFWIVGGDLETIGRQVISYLNPKLIIIMHVWVSEKQYYTDRIKGISGLPPIYYPDESMEELDIIKSKDSLIVTNDKVSGFSEIESNVLSIFPNPAKYMIQVNTHLGNSGLALLEMYSLQGQLMEKDFIKSANTSIDISKYSNGIYYLVIRFDNQVIVKKLIKE